MINKEQAQVLLRYMVKAAEAVLEDNECRNTDYAGECVRHLEAKDVELAHELNELSE